MSAWSQRTKRERILVYAFGAVALLAGVRVMASGSGSDPATDSALPTNTAPSITTPIQPDADGDTKELGYPGKRAKTWKYGPSRDPFEPLVSVTAETAGTDPNSQSVADLPDVLKVDLIDIFVDDKKMVAMVDVNEKRYRGGVGKVLGGEVEVLELSDRCGIFEQGGTRFALCVGQTIERTS